MTDQDAVQNAEDIRRELALRALATAHHFLTAVQEELPALVAGLRTGGMVQVSTEVGHLLDGLGSLARLSLDVTDLFRGLPQGANAGPDIGELARALRDLVHAQEARDDARVAGVIEAEIGPLVGRWREAFASRALALQFFAP